MILNCRSIEFYIIAFYAFCTSFHRVVYAYLGPLTHYAIVPCTIALIMSLLARKGDKIYIYPVAVMFTIWVFITLFKITDVNSAIINRYILLIFLVANTYIIMDRGLEKNEQKILELIFLLAGVVSAIIVFVDGSLYANTGRISVGETNDPNFFAMYVLYPILVSYQYATSKDFNILKRTASILCMIGMIFSVLMTGSRGAMIAILIGMMFVEFAKKNYMIIPIVICVGIAIFSWMSTFSDRFLMEEMVDSGGAGRLGVWLVAMDMVIANPILGIGFHNFGNVYDYYAIFNHAAFEIGGIRMPHNFIVEIITEIGIVGFLIYIYIFLSIIIKKYGLIIKENINTSLISGIVAIFVAAFFLSSICEMLHWFILAMIGAYRGNKSLKEC